MEFFIFIIVMIVVIVAAVRGSEKKRNAKIQRAAYEQYLNEQSQIRQKQFKETIKLITTTHNAGTFFSRIDFAYEIAVEQQCADWVIYIDNNLDQYIRDFIDRSCKYELVKLPKLKNSSSREVNYSAFCSQMKAEFDENIQYTENYMELLERKLQELKDNNVVMAERDTPATVTIERSAYSRNVPPQIFETFKKTIFLNWASHGYQISPDSFYPQYMKYDLEIVSPSKYHARLIEDGLLCECGIHEKLKEYKVAELKELLKKYGLPVKKTKHDLLMASLQLDEDILEKETAHIKRLTLTPDGEAFLDLNRDLVQFYRYKYDFSLAEYIKVRGTSISNFDDIAEVILLQKDKRPNYSSKLHLANLYQRANKQQAALYYYIQTLYYGCDNKYGNNVVPAPAVTDAIRALGDYYNDGLVERCVAENPSVKSVYSKKQFKRIVDEIIAQ